MIDEKLQAAARSAGMIDIADLAMVDTANVLDPKAFLAELKQQKPHLFKAQKQVRDMTTAEYTEARRETLRTARNAIFGAPKTETTKLAKDMSPEEYAAARRKLGVRS